MLRNDEMDNKNLMPKRQCRAVLKAVEHMLASLTAEGRDALVQAEIASANRGRQQKQFMVSIPAHVLADVAKAMTDLEVARRKRVEDRIARQHRRAQGHLDLTDAASQNNQGAVSGAGQIPNQ